MKTPLQVIAEFGCPTESYIRAVQFFSDREDLSFEQYKKGIQEIIGMDETPDCESYHYAKILFTYCVQETIRIYSAGLIPVMETVYGNAISKTYQFMESNPWSATRFNIAHGLQSDDDFMEGKLQSGQFVVNKGAKKEVTERIFKDLKSTGKSRQEIIDAFVAQVGMSKAGATTYFHTLKKELGFSETSNPNKETPKTESKQELAERLYFQSPDKSKVTMIALFTEKLETSKLGAQTYYYACKKKFATPE